MNFSVEKNENFTLIKTDLTELDQHHADDLALQVKALLDDAVSKYVILNFGSILHCNASAVRILISIGKDLQQHNGMLIISNPLDSFSRLFDKAEIVFVPTDDEAIDYVFMDQIEKEFLTNDQFPEDVI